MKKIMVLFSALFLALAAVPAWAQPKEAAPPAAGEKAPLMSPEMMPNMQELLKEMQLLLGQEKITPEQQKKMQEITGKMQGMMSRMHEKMMAMPKEKMAMCPMMQKMEDQGKLMKALEERLDKLEKASGKTR
jgi:hypothetical protein